MVDQVTVPAEEGLSNTPADKADNTQDRPEWLPEKFKTPEDMAKSYSELEKKLSQGQTATGKENVNDAFAKEGEDRDVGNQTVTNEQLQGILPNMENSAIEEMSQSFWENGELSDDNYKTLEQQGYSRDLVDQFIAGQSAMAQSQQDALLQSGGGAERVQAMFDWAGQNMSDEQVAMYNTKFEQGGADAMMAMEALSAKYEQSGVAMPTGGFVTGANAPSYDTSQYTSVDQVRQAMADPRYKTDPAWRKEVSEKLGRSNVL